MDKETERIIRNEVRTAVQQALSPWKSYQGAMAYLGVSRAWISNLVRQQKLTPHTYGSVIRFRTDDLNQLFQK